MNDTAIIYLRLSDKLVGIIDKLAERHGVTRARIVSRILTEFVATHVDCVPKSINDLGIRSEYILYRLCKGRGLKADEPVPIRVTVEKPVQAKLDFFSAMIDITPYDMRTGIITTYLIQTGELDFAKK